MKLPEELATSSPTPTPTLPEMLTICTNEFPESLFPYDGLTSSTKANILAMLQEDPFEMINGELKPVILEKIPAQADGDLRLEPLAVQAGQMVVDANGSLAVLKSGVLVRPSGCRQTDCAITWDGESPLEMDQMVIEYKLRDDLIWSDGIPVSADDSVFSYRLADAPEAPGPRWAVDRTQDYTALDAQTIQWVGRPGFSTAQLEDFFWNPLPSYLFNGTWSWSELLEDERLTTSPLSYGPFLLTSWEGKQIHFEHNPTYTLADEGLPFLDAITIQLVEGGAQ
ncbi:MAG: ABC transporter substrate-binding protein, partial [Chloroflexota bacterium]|nr:ABC transporter substrate-binding protein [Chloroflexota bacterium]